MLRIENISAKDVVQLCSTSVSNGFDFIYNITNLTTFFCVFYVLHQIIQSAHLISTNQIIANDNALQSKNIAIHYVFFPLISNQSTRHSMS